MGIYSIGSYLIISGLKSRFVKYDWIENQREWTIHRKMYLSSSDFVPIVNISFNFEERKEKKNLSQLLAFKIEILLSIFPQPN